MSHRDRHPDYVPGCFGCKAATISVAAAATPNRRPGVVAIDAKQARWDRDGAEYKALRQQGLQPKGIDGSADLAARARTDADIERWKHP